MQHSIILCAIIRVAGKVLTDGDKVKSCAPAPLAAWPTASQDFSECGFRVETASPLGLLETRSLKILAILRLAG